jgi:hypothetical protein
MRGLGMTMIMRADRLNHLHNSAGPDISSP